MSKFTLATNQPKEYQDLSEESRIEQLRHAETMKQYETQKRARSIIVPTSVEEIKRRLRELGHPITLFGEDHGDRRERLREVLARIELGLEDEPTARAHVPASSSSAQEHQQNLPGTRQKEVFYSPASEELIAFRQSLAEASLARSHQRLLSLRRIREDEHLQGEQDQQAYELYEYNKELILNMSQFGDERPMSTVRYSKDGRFLASGSFGPAVKIWDATGLTHLGTFRGHSDRITCTSFRGYGNSDGGDGNTPYMVASSSADGTCFLWDCRKIMPENEGGMDVEGGDTMDRNHLSPKLRVFKGHSGVVSSCEFHPYMDVIATTSSDFTWRLFDIETGKELLLQDGHIKECSGLAFHPDGSLVMTTDSGGVAMLWDLRSGHMIQGFQGHIKKISGVSFNANGFQAATSSLDNTVKIWDLRKRKIGYTLPAHSNVLTDVKYSTSGELMVTSSFDGSIKIWCARDFHIIRTLTGHGNKIMSIDMSPDEKRIVSAGYDRTIKLWAHKNEF